LKVFAQIHRDSLAKTPVRAARACENYHNVKSRQALFSRFAAAAAACYQQCAMRRAVIDIGTNTVKLLVADVQQGQAVTVLSKDKTTRLGEGVDERRQLLPASIARTIQAVREFQAEAETLGATDIIALTTSASRDATNRDEFLDGVRQACGLEVKLISGEREAELIFRGVSNDPEWSGEPILVVDVGGGSAEFIQGRGGKMDLFQSLPLGALRLTEKFGGGRVGELRDHLRATLRPALARYEVKGRRLIGTGGTITTFGKICRASAPLANRGRRQPERLPYNSVDHLKLSYEHVRRLVDRLRAMPLAERKKVPGLPSDRADIIVAGGAVFLAAMEVLGADELTVSVRNLRYGALVEDVPR
jgi:exopolyphosphatase/guanosine-5'-triphosphate,3'-diphosphate pyrophosphatase